MCIDHHREVPVIVSDLNKIYNFLHRFLKNIRILNLIKIRRVGAELVRADGRTDIRTDTTKLPVAFRNFANAPNKRVIPELPLQSILLGPTGISLYNPGPL